MPPPPLPALLESYKTSIFSNQHLPDTNVPPFDRLVFFGENAVQLGIVQYLHGRYSTASANDLKRKLKRRMDSKPNAWGRLYKLRSYFTISSFSSIPQSSGENGPTPISPPPIPMDRPYASLFYAYVGGLFLQDGGDCAVIRQWIKEIFEYELNEGSAESSDEKEVSPSSGRMQPLTRPKYVSPPSSLTEGSPQLARNGMSNDGGSSSNINTNPVSLLNELAMKKNQKVSWEEVATAPSHISEWTSKLKISGWSEEYVGTGSNKKISRAAAAELALRDPGWVSHYLLSDLKSQSQQPTDPEAMTLQK